MANPIKHIVIVGGGTAGWLTAGIVAAEHLSNKDSGIKITLIESSDIPTIGVGEGTWPTMRDTLSKIGISETQFIACCDATFKQGSQFIGWKHQDGSDAYYHPFSAPHGFGQCDLVHFWHQQTTNNSFAHTYCAQAYLCDHNKAPKQVQTPEYAAVANYGYHLNAGKFSELLKQHCTSKLGVTLLDDTVTNVVGDVNSNIEAIETKNSGLISADLFVDCSGSNALLIGQHYKIPFIEQKQVLFNDSAIAVQVPYLDENQDITTHTVSTAHDNGWFWDIALQNRRGIGNVYSSQFTDDETQQQELEQYLLSSAPGINLNDLSFRKLKFNPGYRQKFWHHNCVAIGMAAGFIEPLEASALALVELSAKLLAKDMPANTAVMDIYAKRFNQRFNYRWQRIIDFLKLHYILSDRNSAYWDAHKNAETIPKQLQELLTFWQYQTPSYSDLTEIEEIFPAASYQYVLYGMGFKTEFNDLERKNYNVDLAQKLIFENDKIISQYMANLPSNRELIAHIVKQYQQ